MTTGIHSRLEIDEIPGVIGELTSRLQSAQHGVAGIIICRRHIRVKRQARAAICQNPSTALKAIGELAVEAVQLREIFRFFVLVAGWHWGSLLNVCWKTVLSH